MIYAAEKQSPDMAAIQARISNSARLRARFASRTDRKDAVAGAEYPEEITISRRNGQWAARAGDTLVIDNSPDEALNHLLIRLKVTKPSPAESERMESVIQYARRPTCNVVAFDQKSDVANQHRYVVDFVCGAKLNRGDFERLICNWSRRERDDECSRDGDVDEV